LTFSDQICCQSVDILLTFCLLGANWFISETYSESAPSIKTCEYWFWCFKSGDFDLKDKVCLGQFKKFKDAKLQTLLDENLARTLEELAEVLNVGKSIVSDRLCNGKD